MTSTGSPRQDLIPPDELANREFELVVRRLADDLAYGTDASRYVGPGIEYAQSRLYVPGDPVRQLDWRVSARTGKPHIKEYEALKRVSTYLVVDTSESMFVHSVPLSKHALAVWLASALGLLCLRRLSPVAVVSGGDRPGGRTTPSLLRSDLWQGLDPMRHRRRGEQTRLGETVRDLGQRAGRNSIFMVFSDLHDPEALHALRLTAQRHDVIVLHLQDPVEGGDLGPGFLRGAEAESGVTFLARRNSAWFEGEGPGPTLAGAGVDHLLLRTDQAVVVPLKHFLSSRGQTGRSL